MSTEPVVSLETLAALYDDPDGILTFITTPTKNHQLCEFQSKVHDLICMHPELLPKLYMCFNDWLWTDIIAVREFPGVRFHRFEQQTECLIMLKVRHNEYNHNGYVALAIKS